MRLVFGGVAASRFARVEGIVGGPAEGRGVQRVHADDAGGDWSVLHRGVSGGGGRDVVLLCGREVPGRSGGAGEGPYQGVDGRAAGHGSGLAGGGAGDVGSGKGAGGRDCGGACG